MSLAQDILTDLPTFFNTNDFAEAREFVIADGVGGTRTVVIDVVWDTEVLKKRGAITAAQGVFFGDVKVYMTRGDLPRCPLVGEFIYSPREHQYQILESVETDDVIELCLQEVRSHTY
jgi:hypothetical protein